MLCGPDGRPLGGREALRSAPPGPRFIALVGMFSPAFLTLLTRTGFWRSGGKISWVANYDGTVRDILWASPDVNEPVPEWVNRVPWFVMNTVVLTTASTSPWTRDPTWNNASNTVELVAGGGNGAVGTANNGGGGGGSGGYQKLSNGAAAATTPFAVQTVGGGGFAIWENTTNANCYVCSGAGSAVTTTGGTAGNAGTTGVPAVTFTVTTVRNGNVGGNSSITTIVGGGGGAGASGPVAVGGAGGGSSGIDSGGGGGGGGNAANNGATVNTTAFGTGGNGSSGTGGSSSGAAGTGSSGGAGTTGGFLGTVASTGGNGGSGTDFDASHGMGGGGGGSGANASNTGGESSTGGNGGSFGGGGGGCGACAGAAPVFTAGVGAPGLIFITWVPMTWGWATDSVPTHHFMAPARRRNASAVAATVAAGPSILLPLAQRKIFVTSATVSPLQLPSDWPGYADRIDCVGAGGNGSARVSSTVGGSGGGGGAWVGLVARYNLTKNPTFAVAAAGGVTDTNFDTSAFIAKAGVTGTTGAAGTGGQASASTVPAGGTKQNGGGGFLPGAANASGGGGGGAGGPSGAGATATTDVGGTADNGIVAAPAVGNNGNSGREFGIANGCGSGASGFASGTHNGTNGGAAGGGASGASDGSAGSTGGSGGAGLIVITYTPAPTPVPQGVDWVSGNVTPSPWGARRDDQAGVINASGVSFPPAARSQSHPNGWTVEPPLLDWGPLRSIGAGMVAAGPLLSPAPYRQSAPNGWTVEPPLLDWGPQKTMGAGMAAAGPLYEPEPVILPPPSGWTVEPPLLTYAPRAFSPSAMAATGISLPPESIGRPEFWIVEITNPLIQPKFSPAAQFAGPSYPPTPIEPDVVVGVTPNGYTITLPDLPAFRRYQALPESSLRIDQTTPDQPSVWWGWGAELPITKQPRFSNAAQVATGGYLVAAPFVEVFYPRGWPVTLPDLPAFRRYQQALPDAQPRLDRPSAVLSAVFGGWVVETPTPLSQPKFSHAAMFAGPSLPPEGVQQPQYGWTIEPPLLNYVQRYVSPAAEFSGPLYEPEPVIRPHPYGWTIEPPLLTYTPRAFAPAAMIPASGIVLPPEPVQPTQYGWTVEPPLLNYAVRDNSPGGLFAGPSLPPEGVEQPQYGHSIVLPVTKLPNFAAAAQVAAGPTLVAAPFLGVGHPNGWTVEPPLLNYAQRVVSRSAAFAGATFEPETILLPHPYGWTVEPPLLTYARRPDVPSAQFAGPLYEPEPVQPTQYGWTIEPALTKYAQRLASVSAAFAGPSLPPEVIETPRYGSNVVLPDLPQFIRRQVFPEWAGRFDQPINALSSVWWGWGAELPVTQQPKFRNAAQVAAGPLLTPQVIRATLPYGWTIDLPDLPAFRRYQAMPQWAGRLDPVADVVVTTITWGWDGVPTLARRRSLPVMPEAGYLPPDVRAAVPFGWTFEPPLLTYALRDSTPAGLFAGATYEPESVQPTRYGWSVELPVTRHPVFSLAAQAAAGGLLVPGAIVPTWPTGWSVDLPDLPAFRRYQALPELSLRLDFVTDELPADWWDRLFDISESLSFRRRVLLPDPPTVLGSVGLSPAYGWVSDLPDLPAFRRYQAFPEWAGRLDFIEAELPADWWDRLFDISEFLAFRRHFVLPDPPTLPGPSTFAPPAAWVSLPDLPQFIRHQATPDATWRIDPAPSTLLRFQNEFVLLPTLVRPSRRLWLPSHDIVVSRVVRISNAIASTMLWRFTKR